MGALITTARLTFLKGIVVSGKQFPAEDLFTMLYHIPRIYVLHDLKDDLVGEFLYGVEIDNASLLLSVIQQAVHLFLRHKAKGFECMLKRTGQHLRTVSQLASCVLR